MDHSWHQIRWVVISTTCPAVIAWALTNRVIVVSVNITSNMLSILMATMVGLASSTCSVSSSDEKAEAKDEANYQVTKPYRNKDKALFSF